MSSNNSSWKNYVASITAGASSIFIFNSLDTIRVRWQVINQNSFTSISSYSRDILKNEGFIRGLQLPGMLANITAVGISTGLRLGAYPYAREVMSGNRLAKDTSPFIMFVASLSCGMVSYLLATPIWSVKTRLQSEIALDPSRSRSKMRALLYDDIQKSQGNLLKLWRGATPLVVRGGLLSAGQMGGYDWAKSRLLSSSVIKDGPILHFACSTFSAVLASTISLPVDVLFSRYVTQSNVTLLSCIQTLRKERAFFRGWTALTLRLAPTFSFAMPLYEQIRKALGLGFL